MKPFPWTKTLGCISVVAGIVHHSTQKTYPQVAFWADLVFKCCAGLGIYMARNNLTSSEQVGAGNVPPVPVVVTNPAIAAPLAPPLKAPENPAAQ